MNKENVHYPEKLFEYLFDFSEPKQHEAPAWWDRYVENTVTKTKPVGFELYEKYQKPTVVKSENKVTKAQPFKPNNQPGGFHSTDWFWSEAAQRMVHKNWIVQKDGTIGYGQQAPAINSHSRPLNYMEGVGYASAPRKAPAEESWDNFYRLLGMEETPEDWNSVSPTDLLEAGYVWDSLEKTWRWPAGEGKAKSLEDIATEILNDSKIIRPASITELERLGITPQEAHWEDFLPEPIVTQVLNTNLVTDEDMDYIFDNPHHAGQVDFWKHLMMRKALAACETLQMLGLDAMVNVKSSPPPDAELLPEDKPMTIIRQGKTSIIPFDQRTS
jgi:hypothetical protein